MPTLKQRTIDGQTYELKKYSTDRRGKQFEYYVTSPGMSGRFDDKTLFNKERAESYFDDLIRQVQQGAGAGRQESRGPSLPGFGQTEGERSLPTGGPDFDDEDDDAPWMF